MHLGVMMRHLGEKGGIVTYSRNLMHAFLREGPQHQYTLFYGSRDLLGSFAGPGVQEEVLSSGDKFTWDHWLVPRAASRLGVDVIINPKLSVPLWGRQPRVLVLRPEQFVHPELFKPLDRVYFKTFIPQFCRVAKKVVAPTRIACEHIVKYVGADPRKMEAIHEGCGDHFFDAPSDPAHLAAVRAKYELPESYVLFVGGLTPLKNFERLVKAFAQVQPRHTGLKLVVVGFKRWKFERDLEFVTKHPVAAHIHFPGFVDDADLPAVYRLAQVLFFPSIYEGFGIPIAEAFATGCPVVTSDRGCQPEVAGGCAQLVDPFSVDDMAQGLDRVLDDPVYRQELRAMGLERSPHFRFSRCGRQTLQVLETVAQEG